MRSSGSQFGLFREGWGRGLSPRSSDVEKMTYFINADKIITVKYATYAVAGFKPWPASVNSSCAQPSRPPPLPGYCGTFARLVSPGGGAFANFTLPGGRAFANPELLTHTRFQLELTDVLRYRCSALTNWAWKPAVSWSLNWSVDWQLSLLAQLDMVRALHRWS